MEPVYRRTIRADLTRFGSATGLGTVHGAAAEDFQPGDVVLVADEDSDVLWAEVVATRSGAADVRVFWDRRPVVRTELSPVMRDLGVTEVTDGDLAAGQQLRIGDRLELVDEGGYVYRGVVEATVPARYGGLRYRVRFASSEGNLHNCPWEPADFRSGPWTCPECGAVWDHLGGATSTSASPEYGSKMS